MCLRWMKWRRKLGLSKREGGGMGKFFEKASSSQVNTADLFVNRKTTPGDDDDVVEKVKF